MADALLADSGSVVFPNDRVLRELSEKPVCIGPGLVRSSGGTFVTEKLGLVRQRGNFSFYVDSLQDTVRLFLVCMACSLFV